MQKWLIIIEENVSTLEKRKRRSLQTLPIHSVLKKEKLIEGIVEFYIFEDNIKRTLFNITRYLEVVN